jgi:hypothetical protein
MPITLIPKSQEFKLNLLGFMLSMGVLFKKECGEVLILAG